MSKLCSIMIQLLTLHSERMLLVLAAASFVSVGLILWGTVRLIEWYQKEPILKYTITAPTPPVDGTVLENPSIKVRIASSVPAPGDGC